MSQYFRKNVNNETLRDVLVMEFSSTPNKVLGFYLKYFYFVAGSGVVPLTISPDIIGCNFLLCI